MSPDHDLEPHRARLRSLAYRMLGSVADAEDVVQEAWLRWQRTVGVVEPAAWLTTTVTHLCLDALRAARRRREIYVGPWLPEPIATGAETPDPDSISTALLLLLERLSPHERAAYLLYKVFDTPYEDIARTLDINPPAARQLVHRASAHIADARPRFTSTPARHAEMLMAFAQACQVGDIAALRALLTADARAWSDGGGQVRAARQVVIGADAVARLFVGLARKRPDVGMPTLETVNGLPALVFRAGASVTMVLGIEADDHAIAAVHVVLNPDKLRMWGQDHG